MREIKPPPPLVVLTDREKEPHASRVVLRVIVRALSLALLLSIAVAARPVFAQSFFSVSDTSVTEGGIGGNAVLSFTVELDRVSMCSTTCTIQYRTNNGTATAPGDYGAVTGTLTFNGTPFFCIDQFQTVNVPVVGDLTSEAQETMVFELFNPSAGCLLADPTATGFINNDDAEFQINDDSETEGTPPMPAARELVFTISLRHPIVTSASVNYATAPGTAAPQVCGVASCVFNDYLTASGQVTLGPTVPTGLVRVSLTADTTHEATENMFVDLSGPVGGYLGDARGEGTILDDDAAPQISISDPRPEFEGNTTGNSVQFTISLSASSSLPVTVSWATRDGDAVAGVDYNAASGTETFNPGQVSRNVTVSFRGDSLYEYEERFYVDLSSPSGGTILDGEGFATIANDDSQPSFTVTNSALLEGDSGTSTMIFTVTMSAVAGAPIGYNYFITAISASYDTDFIGGEGGFNIPAGQLTYDIGIPIVGETVHEPDEDFSIYVESGNFNATGIGTILNDDAQPGWVIDDPSITEGNPPMRTPSLVYTISLTNPSSQPLTVDWATAPGTATPGSDYTTNNGFVSLAAGETSQTILVSCPYDTLDELDETVLVNLSAPYIGSYILDGTGVGTIVDDDPSPSLSINDITVTEGDTGTINAVFTVTLSAISGRTVTVDWATANDTAVAPGDYVTDSGVLTFAAGQTTQTITVRVAGDTTDEAAETYFVNLSNPAGATLADSQGLGTITDNDPVPSISVSDVTVTEGNSGSVTMTFNVSLSAISGRSVLVDYATGAGTATPPGDFTAVSGTLTFNPGTSSLPVSVTVFGDTLDELDETVLLDLSGAVRATIADAQGTGTITDDDAQPNMTINDVTIGEGNTGTTDAVFTVSLSAASGRTITVNYATSAGTGTSGTDYTNTSGTLTFDPGTTSLTIRVPIIGDTLDEPNETFNVDLSGAVNVTVTDSRGAGTITDDDNTPSLSVNDVTVTEGNAGTVNAVFTVTLSAASGQTVSVDWATANNTATAGADYTAGSGTLSFATGATTQTFTVTVNADLLDEPNETFFVNLTVPVNATIGDAQGQGTINDDDATPSLSINDVTVAEGNSGTVSAVFTVTLSAASGQTVTVDYATGNTSATSPSDYLAASGTLTFATGVTTRTISVTVNGDTLDENNETYSVTLSNASAATISDTTGVGTITDEDAPPTISITDVSQVEGSAGTSSFVFTVSLSAASGLSVSVNYATANGTATAPADYTTASGTLTFAAGTTSMTVPVTVAGDTLSESNETFNINLTVPVNATIADTAGQGTIIDDDAAPSLFINDVSVTEGNAGTVTATFEVQLTAASGQVVTVDWATAPNTAVAPGDYATGSGNLSFPIGSTRQTFTVTVNGDTLDEADESFFVNLSNPVNAPIIDGQATGTISDDDAPPTVSIADRTVTEGNTGTVNAVFTVTLSAASGQTVTMDWATANVSASAGSDYNTASGSLSFAPGVTSQTLTVVVLADTLDEADETFTVTLSNAQNITVADGVASGQITDDDALPTVTIDDVTVTEGNAGSVTAVFTLTLNTASGRTVSVDYATANGTATAADYTGGSGTVSFTAGQTTRTISVTVLGDTLDEANETFFVDLSNASNVVISDLQGLGTISDDDASPSITITNATVTEGSAGTVNAVFTVSISATSGQTITVDYATANNTATAGSDYTTASGTLVFAAGGATSQTVTVTVTSDTLDELDETFFVNLSNATNATIGDAQGQGTITDDDATPSLTVNNVSVTEGNTGTVNAVFTVTLSAASGQTVSVDYATSNSSATSPADYTATSGTLSFTSGTTTRTFTVTVNADLLDELDETFSVTLSVPVNATISDGTGVGTITDDDATPTLSISDASVGEGNTGTAIATFTVTLSAASGRTVTVDYATSAGTAAAGTDYVTRSGTLSFTAGTTSLTVDVTVNGDTLDEANETFSVVLSNPNTAATIADATGAGTITDDDAAPSLTIDDVTVTEGDAGTQNMVFTVALSAASGQAVSADYTTNNVSAVAPGDFTATSGTLNFAAGVTSLTITVAAAGDALDENTETFSVTLSNPVQATIADGTGVGSILDNDPTPTLSIADASVTEGNAGTATLVMNVTLSAASGRTVTVNYATSDGTATSADYTSGSGTLTFAPGATTAAISIVVSADTLDEANETITVTLSGPVNATLADGTGTGTINDDDAAPAMSIGDVTIVEGNTGTSLATFTVTLAAASGQTVSADYATSPGTAVAPGDYATASGTLSFAAGATSQTFTVTINGDTTDEANETFTVTLSNLSNAAAGDLIATGTINDDDLAPTLSIADVAITEGNTGTSVATFTVTLSAASGLTVTVDYATANDGATAGADYVAGSGTLTFTPGATTRTFTVTVNGDALDEPNETYFVNLSNAVNAGLADSQALGTINDDDATPTLSIADLSISEGDTGTVNAVFTVTLSAASGQTVTASWATANLTATAGSDYVAGSGSLTFLAGSTSQTLSVVINADALDELDETFEVALSAPVNATLADGVAVGTITDDDATPTLSIADVTVTEGTAATVNAVFTVTLSAASGRAVSVAYATTAGTAGAADFTAASGTLNFASGVTTQTFSVAINSDALDEPNETFTVTLSGPVAATIADGTATGTINDDDAQPTISIADATVTEGNTGTINAVFTVTLSAASGQTITTNWATANVTATAGATADYVAGSGTLTFAAGTTSQTINVVVNADSIDEANETFSVTLSVPTAVTIADGSATGTITDDDGSPELTIADVSIAEGNAGSTALTFTVSLLPASGQVVTVDWATANNTALSASDYSAGSGTLTFPIGSTSQTFSVNVTGDTIDEANESFFVNLTNAVNAAISDAQGVGTINDDDAPPNLTISDASTAEGNAGTRALSFTLTLSAVSAQTVTVDWTTANTSATAGSDYVLGSGTVTFAPGATSQTISVTINGDVLDEPDETFTVNLSNGVNVTITDGQGVGTITDDDAPPTISIADATVAEGNAGTSLASFTVSLSAASGRTVTVNYATSGGTAGAAADYVAASGTLTFAPGATSQIVAVTINGDTISEANETFNVVLSAPSFATLLDDTAVGTITDDDGLPTLSITDATVTEGNTGTVLATFNVDLSVPSGQVVTVAWATANASALAGTDYVAGSGTLTFAAGVTRRSFDVAINGDVLDELNETFSVGLSAPVNAAIADGTGVGQINDDDAPPSASIADAAISEGGASVTLTVSLSAASGRSITVDYATADDTAVAGSDFSSRSGTLTFAAGVLTQTLSVPITADTLDEADERLFVNLSNPTNATIGDSQAAITITDDDAPPSVSISDASIGEGHAGTVNMIFNVSLSAASGQTVTVDFATSNASATAGPDYVARSGILSFAPGVTAQTISVTVNGDALDEPNETFAVNLSNGINVTIADGAAAGTITDDDGAPSISVADVTVLEDESSISFAVILSNTSGLPVSVDWATIDGTAIDGADYTGGSGTLSFPAGTTAQSVVIALLPDALDELDESFTLELSGATNAAIGDGEAAATITDDDAEPSLMVADLSIIEGTAQTTAAQLTVALSAPSGRVVSVDYVSTDGTARAPEDYAALSGTLTFQPGETTAVIDLAVEGDALDEDDPESFTVSLLNAVNATTADDLAAISLADDDAAPSLSIADASATEGASGSLVVSLSAPSGREVAVSFATMSGSATEVDDYAAAAGTLIFAPGVTTQPIGVQTSGDAADEPDETVLVALSAAVNASIAVSLGTLTILDDDVPPNLSLELEASTPFTVGGQATYTITVANRGPGPTTGAISVSDMLPAGVSLASSSGDGWTCADFQGAISCSNMASLAPSAELDALVLTVDIAPEAFPKVVNTATVATAGDFDLSDNAQSAESEVIGLVDLMVEKTGPAEAVMPGSMITWRITITNLGPNVLTDLFVDEMLPSKVTEVTYMPGPEEFDPVSGHWDPADVPVNGTIVLTVSGLLSATATGSIENRVIISVPDGYVDVEARNDTAVAITPVIDIAACDDDGLSDEEEEMLGTDPCNPDSDGDGLPDGVEVEGENPTDPTDPDSDDDLLCDGDQTVANICAGGEDLNLNGKFDAGETNPNDDDTDDGGVKDGEERLRGSDPTVAKDDPETSCNCGVTSERSADRSLYVVLAFALMIVLRRRRLV